MRMIKAALEDIETLLFQSATMICETCSTGEDMLCRVLLETNYQFKRVLVCLTSHAERLERIGTRLVTIESKEQDQLCRIINVVSDE